MLNKDAIRLGLLAPLTGLVGMYGEEISRAAKIACDNVNKSGGLLGKKLELVVVDDGSMPETAVPAAHRLIDEFECDAMIGNLLSNSRIDVAYKVAQPRQVPYLNFSFYEGSISSRYFFNFAALPNQQIDKMIPYMAGHFGPKFFFAGSNYEWPLGSIDACKRSLDAFGGEVVGERYLPIGTEDIDGLLKELATSGADVFVPYFAGSDQINLLTRFTEMGLKDRMKVVMGHYDEVMVSNLPAHVREGFFSSNTYFMTLQTRGNMSYLKDLLLQPDVSGVWPDGNGLLTNFGEGTYTCVLAFAEAVKKAGNTQAENLVDTLRNVSVNAPQGRVTMDPVTHHATVNSYLTRCDANGVFRLVRSFGQIEAVIPERYKKQAEAMVSASDNILPFETLHNRQTAAEIESLAGEPENKQEKNTECASRSTAETILSTIDVSVVATNGNGVIVNVNDSACELFDYTRPEMIGMDVNLLLPPRFRSGHSRNIKKFLESMQYSMPMDSRTAISGYRKDGSEFPAEASLSKFKGPDGWVLVVTLKDASERRKHEEELIWQATHDPLTLLPNRTLMDDRLTNSLDRSKGKDYKVAMLFIDLDEFKMINDSYGHNLGDDLLVEISNRILMNVRPGDTVARFGGDEFIVLCDFIDDMSTVTELADKIIVGFKQPVLIDGQKYFATVSIGIAYGSGSTHTPEDMLRHADAAMYHAKSCGRDRWKVFDEAIDEDIKQQLVIANGLRTAIENHEFKLYYQPIVDVRTKKVVGAEALIRWFPESGQVSPALFIPVAEMTGVISAIGDWVFEEACAEAARWEKLLQGKAKKLPYLSVNLSTRQLNELDLANKFKNMLIKHAVSSDQIILEITETSLMADVDSNIQVLRELGEMGLRLAVDDFGTGYSSLSQLNRMPVSDIKVDKSFVDILVNEHSNQAIVEAIIQMSHTLGLKVTAEGVESWEQFDILESLGCNRCQGYLFYKPMSAEDFRAMLMGADKSSLKTA